MKKDSSCSVLIFGKEKIYETKFVEKTFNNNYVFKKVVEYSNYVFKISIEFEAVAYCER